MNRRELLQFFGIGTLITPVAAPAVVGKLLAVPDIESRPPFPDGHVPALFRDRLKWNPYEAIWLYFWQIENNPPTGINSGIGPLEHILGREATEAEKAAVAGLMQWFGSNCGHAFIEETLEACGCKVSWREDPKAKQIRQLQHGNIWLGRDEPRSVRLTHRGRQIELRTGDPGGLL